jgi:glycine/D-amino acid oxidase-like deaminating enzyme
LANLGKREFVVIGAGVVGASIAWGLARAGARPLVLDEGDLAPRASRANHALVWVQGEGHGLADYGLWTLGSARRWPQLAAELKAETGIDVALSQQGGFSFCLSRAELDRKAGILESIDRETGGRTSPFMVLDSNETRTRLPGASAAVAGTIFCPDDGHVNVLRLFHALHAAMAVRGCEYRACHGVEAIEPVTGGFRLTGTWGEVQAEKVVLAAGLGNERLAPMVGLHSPLKRCKGQILVTEKCAPFFPYASLLIIQSSEGGILVGASKDPSSPSPATSQPINAVLAQRALLVFPQLAALNVVRSWAGFRIKTPDEFPVYEQSARAPGAFVATCHSGVCLAANHALVLAPQILAGQLSAELSPYSARRLRVPQDH